MDHDEQRDENSGNIFTVAQGVIVKQKPGDYRKKRTETKFKNFLSCLSQNILTQGQHMTCLGIKAHRKWSCYRKRQIIATFLQIQCLYGVGVTNQGRHCREK
jgi:hypothetical protein